MEHSENFVSVIVERTKQNIIYTCPFKMTCDVTVSTNHEKFIEKRSLIGQFNNGCSENFLHIDRYVFLSKLIWIHFDNGCKERLRKCYLFGTLNGKILYTCFNFKTLNYWAFSLSVLKLLHSCSRRFDHTTYGIKFASCDKHSW